MQEQLACFQEQLQGLNTGGKNYCVITQDRVMDDSLKSKLKTELCVLADYSY